MTETVLVAGFVLMVVGFFQGLKPKPTDNDNEGD
jgi:hypothetical protein